MIFECSRFRNRWFFFKPCDIKHITRFHSSQKISLFRNQQEIFHNILSHLDEEVTSIILDSPRYEKTCSLVTEHTKVTFCHLTGT